MKASIGTFNQKKGTRRGLLHDCEILFEALVSRDATDGPLGSSESVLAATDLLHCIPILQWNSGSITQCLGKISYTDYN